MRLFVRDLAGRTLPVSVDGGADVACLQQQIEAAAGVPEDAPSQSEERSRDATDRTCTALQDA
eukprot:924600-Alexandrium_andersonii.AAC.1